MSPTNLELAELLAHAGEQVEDFKQRAYRRAARAALAWPEEAAAVVQAGRSLTELHGVGDRLARRIEGWIEDLPEITWEIPAARRGFSTLAVANAIVEAHPDWTAHLEADLQMHSIYSDGDVSIETMANAARSLGHSFIAITDHSQGLRIAGGMGPDELRAQALEIAQLNEKLTSDGFEILHALEMNIGVNGEGDMEPGDLAGLDLVLGSFHSKLRGAQDQTHRYLAALDNPHFHVLGHPRGRMFGTRAGLQANWKLVFESAAQAGKAVEIDCNPNRQDLNAELAALAVKAGCYLSIGTDAHSTHELTFINLGVATALAAGAERERILNYMTPDGLRTWVETSR